MKKPFLALLLIFGLIAEGTGIYAQTAEPTSQTVYINKKAETPPVYSIDGSNYFRLRDVAAYLDFGVDYNESTNSVFIDMYKPCADKSDEAETLYTSDAHTSVQPVFVNGEKKEIGAYLINGSNYFKIRDLAKTLNFSCLYNNELNAVEINKNYGYDPSDRLGASKLTGTTYVSFIDVGQGDSAFVELYNGRTLLIDAGDSGHGSAVADFIRSRGKTSIDYAAATHPHADHIGGMAEVLNGFNVGKMYMPDVTADSKTYQNLMQTVQDRGIEINTAENGVNIYHDEVADISIIAPCSGKYDDLNNYSAVIKVTYGDNKFLFMGDAETKSENEITADVSANVVKVGHHGSKTSSSQSFTERTGADFAVISVGANNSYNHPAPETVSKWQSVGAEVLRTDLLGNICFLGDGEKLSYKTDRNSTPSEIVFEPSAETGGGFVLNTSTKKIHLPSCRYAKSISEKNRSVSSKSLSELESQGYEACKVCKP